MDGWVCQGQNGTATKEKKKVACPTTTQVTHRCKKREKKKKKQKKRKERKKTPSHKCTMLRPLSFKATTNNAILQFHHVLGVKHPSSGDRWWYGMAWPWWRWLPALAKESIGRLNFEDRIRIRQQKQKQKQKNKKNKTKNLTYFADAIVQSRLNRAECNHWLGDVVGCCLEAKGTVGFSCEGERRHAKCKIRHVKNAQLLDSKMRKPSDAQTQNCTILKCTMHKYSNAQMNK